MNTPNAGAAIDAARVASTEGYFTYGMMLARLAMFDRDMDIAKTVSMLGGMISEIHTIVEASAGRSTADAISEGGLQVIYGLLAAPIEVGEKPPFIEPSPGRYRPETMYTRAQQHRLHYVLDILDGYADGIDYELLAAGLAFARYGGKRPFPKALIALFASPYVAAQREGEWEGDPEVQALDDLEKLACLP